MGIRLSPNEIYSESFRVRSLRSAGFSLFELLLVVAVIGILIGLLIPAVWAVRTQVLTMKSRVQFNQYILALESYKQVYGYYPNFDADTSPRDISFSLINPPTRNLFIEVLSAKPVHNENQVISDEAMAFNRKGIIFYNFTQSEFNANGDIIDSFNNRDIRFFLDVDANGYIDNEKMMREFKDTYNNVYIPDSNDLPRDIRASIVVISTGDRGEFIKSWD